MSESGLTYYRRPLCEEWEGKAAVVEQMAVMMAELRYPGLAAEIRECATKEREYDLDRALVEAHAILNNLVHEESGLEWKLTVSFPYRLEVGPADKPASWEVDP